MARKTPQQYIESLNDGRVTYWDGERIDDITTHPRFQVPLALTASDYDDGDPEVNEFRFYRDEEGNEHHRIFQIPTTKEHLVERVEMMKQTTIGTLVTGVFMALMSVKDDVAKVNPRYADNIERIYKYARDNDLRGAEVITDPKGDRKRRANEQDDPDLYVRIVERREDGIVVRGAKLHITAASLVHELVVMPTKGMRPEEADYAVSFSIPVNTPGVSIINRSFAPAELNEFDYPASSHHSMPEGFVVFDDVFVPWDRVFLAGEVELASVLARSLGLWERTGGLVESVRNGELYIGLAQLVSEMQGKDKDPVVQSSLSELIVYQEMIRMGLDYACEHYETSQPSGMVFPNTLAVNATKYYLAANFHQTIKYLHDLAGGLVITVPMEADLRNEESGKFIRKYLYTRKDVDIEARMRVYNLIRDLTADAYGGWWFVVALQSGGGLPAQRTMMNRTFDMEKAKAAARKAAGIS
ncbi:aromatic ring hydroxylase [Sphingobium indicum IP26]|uniref:4-hydroxyphenylacetate 3-hydroxylase n=1 Tax=Sphingobium indicum F2 TaxID=1450518 RepID=A0A8E0WPL3_9SPHN|nr:MULTISPECIES: 4-hydroxyphenylacetate 3-hydroxylase N-terminal domain-containing protein [Sphingobium]EPR15226.1 aromatic ring hydroxylase [Sphingobium indicum IP26]EQB03038.1 aromatic ring hydroxylase [Sphingobium sp. HDIP04]KER34967.1 4-hydroxyphenylacetate 3-hydroxylase [Sphingobium indicum F2]KER35497.1 4-hydroxyphenylacetate 3-hydroxylase [Sphingobium indicum F2]